ncbi:MAG: chorismate-binding protein [Saprospiraceae bacterium]|nr:chorismate-binding protein [Saprospiraceae bacterium]
MEKTKLYVQHRRYLGDVVTPVGLYLNLRAHYPTLCLLESNDSRSAQNSTSILGFEPLATFKVEQGEVAFTVGQEVRLKTAVTKPMEVADLFQEALESLEIAESTGDGPTTGFVGHTNFDAVQYFDTLQFDPAKRITKIPELHYVFYRYFITIDHHKDLLHLTENNLENQSSELESIHKILFGAIPGTLKFSRVGSETSNWTDQEFIDLVEKGKHHCRIGDVFQIVLSRQFRQEFKGDEFNVYRVLRSINPSPYLYFFNFGSYKIFGSSPEAQLVLRDGTARLNPIAGTYRRSGDDDHDLRMAEKLAEDPKEVAEHIMLVDLARNDLGRHGNNVQVKTLKEIQYFSHVIHLVSTVEATLPEQHTPMEIFGDTFPAGTLSGAPKYKALELINAYENTNRSFYGGGLGFIDLNGNMNQAIVIRSFLSIDNCLISQAGAGVVSASVAESELQEVNNKLGALKRAIELAENL